MARRGRVLDPPCMDDLRSATARWLLGLLTLAGCLAGIDLLLDARTELSWRHALTDLAVVGTAIVGLALLHRQGKRERAVARAALEGADAQAQAWRAEADLWRARSQTALRGLGAAIEEQFVAWDLSPAERDVALLLLKGLSHKEVAHLRGTSERTVGQQARAIYRKGGLGGRAELSAFFLEDLLLPSDDRRPLEDDPRRAGP
jgi:DNA-binding CsgD family transcriptional regulator